LFHLLYRIWFLLQVYYPAEWRVEHCPFDQIESNAVVCSGIRRRP